MGLIQRLTASFVTLASPSLHNALRHHGVGNLHEAGDVSTLHVVDVAVLLTILHALTVDVRHDAVQLFVNLCTSPCDAF